METTERSTTVPSPGVHPPRRIDVEACAQRVRVEFGGELVADSTRTLLLHEENYPPVHYFPRDDVRMDLLTRTDHVTHCPYKGDASYWTVEAGGRTAQDSIWSYEQPIPRDGRHRRLPRLLPRPHGRLVGRERYGYVMKLDREEQAMLDGRHGPARREALRQQMEVGRVFDAEDFVEVAHAHLMADTESLGESGVEWLEAIARLPEAERRVRVPTVTDPRGIDFCAYRRLRQEERMAVLERRADRRARVDGHPDDRHVHQLPVGVAAGAGRTSRLRRYRVHDLREQRARRPQQLRGRPGRALRRADGPGAALRLPPRRAPARHPALRGAAPPPDLERLGRARRAHREADRRLLVGAGRHRHRRARRAPTSSSTSAPRSRATARCRSSI